MIRTIKGLAAARPPIQPTPGKPGPSITEGMALAGRLRSSDLSTLWRVVGQSKAVSAEIWFSDGERQHHACR